MSTFCYDHALHNEEYEGLAGCRLIFFVITCTWSYISSYFTVSGCNKINVIGAINHFPKVYVELICIPTGSCTALSYSRPPEGSQFFGVGVVLLQ